MMFYMKVRTGMPFVIIVKKIESDDAKHNKITVSMPPFESA